MSLVLDNVSYAYAAGTELENTALRSVSLSVERGGLAVVVGATGSGKTTLLRLAAGLLRPSGGSVTIDGSAAAAHRDFRGSVGLVFQRPESQFFAASVMEDVEFGPRNLGLGDDEARAAAVRALEAVGIDAEAFGERMPFTLSGGEARRVALAGVLAMRPAYLLLDEPTAGLDAPGRCAVLAAIGRARQDTGVVVVTHDADDLLADADAVLVLKEGRAEFAGPVSGMLQTLIDRPGAFESPSEVARAQLLVPEAQRRFGAPTIDPDEAARRLATVVGSGGGRS